MASILGFELKAIKKFRGITGEPLLQANLCYKDIKVGFISEEEDGGLPTIRIEHNFYPKWRDAIAYFKEHFYDSSDIATGEELFYFLLTLKEWELILKQQLSSGVALVVVLEEMDGVHGYRTGGYKIYTPESEEELKSLIDDAQRSATEDEPVWWKKMSFRSMDELNFG